MRLRGCNADMPRFVYDLVVALTNNPAERVLCVMKLFIKISSRFRSEHGARDSATIRNALLTVRKQGSNGIEALRRNPTSLSAGLQSQPAIRPRDSCLPLAYRAAASTRPATCARTGGKDLGSYGRDATLIIARWP